MHKKAKNNHKDSQKHNRNTQTHTRTARKQAHRKHNQKMPQTGTQQTTHTYTKNNATNAQTTEPCSEQSQVHKKQTHTTQKQKKDIQEITQTPTRNIGIQMNQQNTNRYTQQTIRIYET